MLADCDLISRAVGVGFGVSVSAIIAVDVVGIQAVQKRGCAGTVLILGAVPGVIGNQFPLAQCINARSFMVGHQSAVILIVDRRGRNHRDRRIVIEFYTGNHIVEDFLLIHPGNIHFVGQYTGLLSSILHPLCRTTVQNADCGSRIIGQIPLEIGGHILTVVLLQRAVKDLLLILHFTGQSQSQLAVKLRIHALTF